MIFRYDKQTKVIGNFRIATIGGENDYYTNFYDGRKDTSIENPLLSQIDGNYSKLIEKFNPRMPIDGFKEDIILFMTTQYARVRPQKNRWQTAIESLNSQRAQLSIPQEKLWPVDNSLNLAMLIEAQVHSQIISNTSFPAVFISDQHEFITCDNPADRSFLPLTKTMCLMMPSKQFPMEYTDIPEALVSNINRMTFDKAHRWVYSSSEHTITNLIAAGRNTST